ADPVLYHGPGKFDPAVGIQQSKAPGKRTFTQVFSDWLCDMGQQDPRLVAVTPAMREGSGLVEFEKRFPQRYFDVGIAEQHAVTFAAGVACEAQKPVLAIYSTFLQRGYDQLIHDVALQNLDVTFALDRAGIVGADGATHAGNYDTAFLRCVPNMVVATPSDENETRLLLSTCYQYPGPASVRYPRGAGCGAPETAGLDTVELGRGVVRREGRKIAILGFGTLLQPALAVAEKLDATVADMRFVKPIDRALILDLASRHDALVTIEDAAIMGGAGSAVLEVLAAEGVSIPVLQLGFPDEFIDHGDQLALLAGIGLDAAGIEQSIRTRYASLLA
ncbi:MAG: 1-deoxy-D-xylulose-5-phosphate synthase, partial [Achromobacter xylosoxidans]|nr:1-deoxy-D-xylulose-5-phosphate synthase [Achromobacter xylosoxidans]